MMDSYPMNHCAHGKRLNNPREDCVACEKLAEIEERKQERLAELETQVRELQALIERVTGHQATCALNHGGYACTCEKGVI